MHQLLPAQYHTKKEYKEGDRIPYASRVYDEKEMCTLTDAVLDFWLTTGRFSDQFEKEFAEYMNIYPECRELLNNLIKIKNEISFEVWSTFNDKTCIRFVTSFLTTTDDIINVIKLIKQCL